jgi:Na+/H+-dicarboxylate symporter
MQDGPDIPEPRELLAKINFLLRSRLWAQILVAMLAGIGLGLWLSPRGGGWLDEESVASVTPWIGLPGTIFLALIQMVVIPLVSSSIVLGITSSGDPRFLARVGGRIGVYFVGTTAVACALGAAVALLIEPGSYIDSSLVEQIVVAPSATDAGAVAEFQQQSIPERLSSLIPTNMAQAEVEGAMLQIVIGAIFSGVALISIPRHQARPLLKVLEATQNMSMKIVSWAMVLAPFAVFGLLCDITIRVGVDAILGMSVYVGTVLLGLLCLVIVYLIIVTVLGRSSPIAFMKAVREPQLLAFSTSSSAAVMPLSMTTAEKKLGVRPAVSKFVIPLGATINMDGTALYQVIAAVFLTQVFGVELTTGGLIVLMATTIGASIGSPSTPGVGIVILGTILAGIGVPAGGIALIIGVDRILDMSRTSVNVTGDLAACVVMNRWLGDFDQSIDEESQRYETETDEVREPTVGSAG